MRVVRRRVREILNFEPTISSKWIKNFESTLCNFLNPKEKKKKKKKNRNFSPFINCKELRFLNFNSKTESTWQ